MYRVSIELYNTSGSLGEREMLWEHEPQASVQSTAFFRVLPNFHECLYLTNRIWFSVVYLTNRFHGVVRLFSNRSQMTSKCGKNKKVAHEA